MTEVVTQPDVLGSLGINGKLFISQLVNVAIILFVVWRWIYRPLLKVMDKREHKIKEGLEHAMNAKRWVAEAAQKKEEMLREATAEYQRVIQEAGAKAESIRQEVLHETQLDLDRQLQDARTRLKGEKEAMMQTAKNELVTLIAAATERVTEGLVDGRAERISIEQAIKQLEHDKQIV